jgi:hypothetical protein
VGGASRLLGAASLLRGWPRPLRRGFMGLSRVRAGRRRGRARGESPSSRRRLRLGSGGSPSRRVVAHSTSMGPAPGPPNLGTTAGAATMGRQLLDSAAAAPPVLWGRSSVRGRVTHVKCAGPVHRFCTWGRPPLSPTFQTIEELQDREPDETTITVGQQLDPRGYLTEGPDESGKRSWAMYEADDGTAYYGLLAIIMMNAEWGSGQFRGLQRDTGHGPETHDEWRCRTQVSRQVATIPQRGPRARSSHGPAPVRRRGSRRRSGSSPPSEDPDGDDPPGVSGPPARRDTAGVAT